MKFKGSGIVWDAERNCILCKFENGELVTEDVRVIEILQENNYAYEELEDEINMAKMKVVELKEILDRKGIEYDSKAKREDLTKLLEGAE